MAGIAIVALMLIVLLETGIIAHQRLYIQDANETRRELEALLYERITTLE